MAQRLLPALDQVFSNLGEIGTGFKLLTYQTGTTTPLATYSNEALTIANANPATGSTTGNQIADASGRFGDLWVDDLSSYKVVLNDADGVFVDSADPVDGAMANSLIAFDPIPEAFWGTTAGSSSAYTLDSNVDISTIGYTSTQIFKITFHTACAAAPTLAIDGLDALNLKKYTGQGTKVALLAGDVQNQTYDIRNDGTDLVVLNPRTQMLYLGGAPTITIVAGVATLTNTTSHYLIEGEGVATDTLDTISGLVDGQEVVLQIVSAARPITFSLSGNIITQSGETLIVNSTTTQIRGIYRASDSKFIIESNSRPLIYMPANQTITSSATLTLAHGLGKAPDNIRFTLVCTGAEFGYVVGDEIVVTPNNSCSSGADNFGFVAQVNATNILILFGANAAVFYNILNKTTRDASAGTLTNANWTLKVRAFLFT